jgi:hypothetical protein
MSETVTRDEFNLALERIRANEQRLDEIDRIGTRGVAVLAVQVSELTKDVGAVQTQLEGHRREHAQEVRDRRSTRRLIIGWGIILFAALESPLVALLITHKP